MSSMEVIGDCTLYQGDCLEILPTLGKFDAVVTDPPYGVNLGNHRGANEHRAGFLVKRGYESYDDTPENFDGVVVPACVAALAVADRGLIFMAAHTAWKLPTPSALGGVYIPSGMGRNPWGFATLQHCLLYGSAPDLHLGAKATSLFSTEVSEKSDHPCPKPLGWMKWAVSLASKSGQSVIDPFMGSGTTVVACVKLGRKFTGIEIEEKYFSIACKRIEAATREPRLPLAEPKPKQQTMELI